MYNFKYDVRLILSMLTISILFLTELYNSLRGFLLYFKFNCRDESCSSYLVGLLLIFFWVSPLKRALFIHFEIILHSQGWLIFCIGLYENTGKVQMYIMGCILFLIFPDRLCTMEWTCIVFFILII